MDERVRFVPVSSTRLEANNARLVRLRSYKRMSFDVAPSSMYKFLITANSTGPSDLRTIHLSS
jgi:hypothetical protein